jgi:uncharacterized protein YjbJ (UPF0337 family)
MNSTNTEGVWDQTKGKVKQTVGEAFNDDKLANEGAADQVKGHAEEAWGNVKDTAHDLTHGSTATSTDAHVRAEQEGHDARNSVADAAEHMKDSINRGLDHLKGH